MIEVIAIFQLAFFQPELSLHWLPPANLNSALIKCVADVNKTMGFARFGLFCMVLFFASFADALESHLGNIESPNANNTKPFGDLTLSLSLKGTIHKNVGVLKREKDESIRSVIPESFEKNKKLEQLQLEIAAIEERINARHLRLNVDGAAASNNKTDISSNNATGDVVESQSNGRESYVRDLTESSSLLSKRNNAIGLSGWEHLKWIPVLFFLMLATYGLFRYRRRKISLPAIASSREVFENRLAPVTAQPGFSVDISEKDMPLKEISSQSESLISQNSLLPPEYEMLEEADIYLRFGHDKLAEEALKEAIKINPENSQAYLTLLRIYFSREDNDSFYESAKRVKAIGDIGAWMKVAEMGRKLDENNALYR